MKVVAKSGNVYLILLNEKTKSSLKVSILNDGIFVFPGRRLVDEHIRSGNWSEVGAEESQRVLEIVSAQM